MSGKVLSPIAITPDMVTACSVAEPDSTVGEVEWDAATSYAVGQEVVRTTTHRLYANLIAGVDATPPENAPNRWMDVRPTNKFAAFDHYQSTAIRQAGTLTMTVKPGIITDMVWYGLEGDSLHVVCKNATSGAVYHDETIALSQYLSGDLMWEFYFGVARQRQRASITGLVPDDALVELTLTASPVTGFAGIGIWALGHFDSIGLPLTGFTAEPITYRRIKTDDYGNLTVTGGPSAKNLNGNFFLPSEEANALCDIITRNLGVPCAWVVSQLPQYDYLSAFGLGEAKLTADNASTVGVSMTVRGTI